MKALILGGVSWNTMVYLDHLPTPQSHTLFARGSRDAIGSSGAGKAMNLRHLGADVTLWGLVGDDANGEKVREALQRWGVEFHPHIDPRGTQRHINLMDERGRRVSIFVAPGSDEIPAGFDPPTESVLAADLVSVTILNHCRPFLPWLKELGKAIWVDIHDYDGVNPHHAAFIEAADFLFMSSVADLDWRGFLEARIEAGTQVGVCTHGADGASGITPADGWVDVEAVPVPELVDSNGAGDAFFAGFAIPWSEGRGLAESLDAGALAAAQAIRSPELAPLPRTD